MAGTGFELTHGNAGNAVVPMKSGAESGALSAREALDPGLATVVRAWPSLSPRARAKLLAIVAGENCVSELVDASTVDSISVNAGKTAILSTRTPKK